MAGSIQLTQSPTEAVQAHLFGRRLITPSVLAAYTWGAEPCSLDDLVAEHQAGDQLTEPEALDELIGLLGEPPYGSLAPATPELLAALRTVLAADTGANPPLPGLVALARAYADRLRARSLNDPFLPHLPQERERQPLLIHGYATLTEFQMQLLTRLASDDSVLVLPVLVDDAAPGRLLSRLRALGWQVATPAAPEGRPVRPPSQVMIASDPLHEARAALAIAADLQTAGAVPPRILLTARAPETYRAALTIAARERNRHLHWLTTTSAQSAAGTTLELIAGIFTSGWAYEAVCALLASPLVDDLAPTHWQTIRRVGAGSQRHWAAPHLLPREVSALRHLPDHATLRNWHGMLGAVPGVSGLLSELHALMASQLPETSDQRTYGAALHRALQRPTLAAGTMPATSIIVAPADALPGVRADLVLVLGLSEGVWPSPPNFRPPLDAHTRAALDEAGLGVTTVVAHVQAERSLYSWAHHAAPHHVAFTPQVVNGSRQLPSDLVHGAALLPAPPHALAPTDPPDAPPPMPPSGAPFDLDDLRFSPTQLTRFGQCAFRWFAQYGLGLGDHEEPQATLAPHVRGRLYHQTLDHVAKHLQGDPTADRLTLVDAGFALAEAEEHLDRLTNWNWQRGEHLRHLQALVVSAEFLPDGNTITSSEHAFLIDWKGLRVQGTLDRLDKTPDGYQVTDYKTGTTSPKGAKGEGGRLSLDVQLPVYLAAATALAGHEVTQGRYLSVTGAERRVLGVATPDDVALEQLVSDLFDAVDTGHFPVNPDATLDACTQCPYSVLCRHGGAQGGWDESGYRPT